jgi:chromosomal replication initiation ATPase DnaA
VTALDALDTVVAVTLGTTVQRLHFSRRRDVGISHPRAVAMYFGWMVVGESFPRIARHYGLKDHTSALYARDRIAGEIAAGWLPEAALIEARLRAALASAGFHTPAIRSNAA